MRCNHVVTVLFLMTAFVTLAFVDAASTRKTLDNTRPLVKFISPKPGSKFQMNTMLPYVINVSDKEDGESKFEEIPFDEVYVQANYFGSRDKAAKYIAGGGQADPAGLSAIKRSDCFNCHQHKSKFIGPSFEQISQRYPSNRDNVDKLVGHVKKGVSGIWGATVMPAHPDIKDTTAANIVRWILENGNNPTLNIVRGMQGALICNTALASSEATFVLTASYNDHGTEELPGSSLKGHDMIMITGYKKK